MIAIFNTAQAANAFSNKIDAFLRENRQGYNAAKWSELNESSYGGEWMVQVHPDIDELENKFSLEFPDNNPHLIVRLVETLPDNWYNNDEII